MIVDTSCLFKVLKSSSTRRWREMIVLLIYVYKEQRVRNVFSARPSCCSLVLNRVALLLLSGCLMVQK